MGSCLGRQNRPIFILTAEPLCLRGSGVELEKALQLFSFHICKSSQTPLTRSTSLGFPYTAQTVASGCIPCVNKEVVVLSMCLESVHMAVAWIRRSRCLMFWLFFFFFKRLLSVASSAKRKSPLTLELQCVIFFPLYLIVGWQSVVWNYTVFAPKHIWHDYPAFIWNDAVLYHYCSSHWKSVDIRPRGHEHLLISEFNSWSWMPLRSGCFWHFPEVGYWCNRHSGRLLVLSVIASGHRWSLLPPNCLPAVAHTCHTCHTCGAQNVSIAGTTCLFRMSSHKLVLL